MKTSAFHLNLLKETEKLSSSPVRLRIMLPVLAILACVGMGIWWAIIFGQSLMVNGQIKALDAELTSKKNAHAEIMQKMDMVRELQLQLEQLDYYKGGIRHLGEPLAKFAEVIPLRVQMTSFKIVEPPLQNLTPPGAKVPLFGPTENVETQKLVIVGRTTKETPLVAMMDALDTEDFTKLVTHDKKVTNFQQDTAEFENKKLLSFELDYTMPERSFAR